MDTILNTPASLVVFIAVMTWNPVPTIGRQINPGDSLTVNFISIGQGVDYKAQERFSRYLDSFQKKNHITLDYKSESWGKEGETTYIIYLDKLSAKHRRSLMDGLNEMFSNNKLVQLGSPPPE